MIMKRKLKNLIGFTIAGTDGEIGKVKEFYFDDKSWTIRYFIVETGSWLFGRKVLLSPQAVTNTDWDQETFQTNLKKDQIENSPLIDTDKSVSRQHEMALHSYYPWGGYYWASGMGTSGMMTQATLPLEQAVHIAVSENDKENDNDPHLRSTNKVNGYNIQATDGEIGDVEDFIINDLTWKIDFIEVDTGHWFPGKKVLISPKWIKSINWETASVVVSATEEQVKHSPEYVPSQELSDSYKANLQNYYGRFITHK